jgi:hypothetical protein
VFVFFKKKRETKKVFVLVLFVDDYVTNKLQVHYTLLRILGIDIRNECLNRFKQLECLRIRTLKHDHDRLHGKTFRYRIGNNIETIDIQKLIVSAWVLVLFLCGMRSIPIHIPDTILGPSKIRHDEKTAQKNTTTSNEKHTGRIRGIKL